MNKLIIAIEDGMVIGVYSTDPEVEVIVQDYDNIRAGDPAPIPTGDMDILLKEATENCRAVIKAGRFFSVY